VPALPGHPHPAQRQGGVGGRLLGALLPHRRHQRQDPVRGGGRRHPLPGGPPGQRGALGDDPLPEDPGQHSDWQRHPDRLRPRLPGGARVRQAAAAPQDEHREGGGLDRLQHHRRQPHPDTDRDRRGCAPAPDRHPGEGRLQGAEGGRLGRDQPHLRRHRPADRPPLRGGRPEAVLRPAGCEGRQDGGRGARRGLQHPRHRGEARGDRQGGDDGGGVRRAGQDRAAAGPRERGDLPEGAPDHREFLP